MCHPSCLDGCLDDILTCGVPERLSLILSSPQHQLNHDLVLAVCRVLHETLISKEIRGQHLMTIIMMVMIKHSTAVFRTSLRVYCLCCWSCTYLYLLMQQSRKFVFFLKKFFLVLSDEEKASCHWKRCVCCIDGLLCLLFLREHSPKIVIPRAA